MIIGFLSYYLYKNWDSLGNIFNLSIFEVSIIYAISLGATINSGFMIRAIFNSLNVKTHFWDMVFLQNATNLLNYLPMKFGTVFRANYLKRHYGLSYAHFGTFFVYLTLLMTAIACLVSLVVLIFIYGIQGYEQKIMAGVFFAVLIFTMALLFLPLPVPKGSNRIMVVLRTFLSGRHQLMKDKRTLALSAITLTINFFVSSVRLGIIYHSIGQDIHPAGYLILGSVGFVSLFTSITPGALGIRELFLGAGAVVLGISPEAGILGAMIDRAIAITITFVFGGICTAILWRKTPGDFKNIKKEEI